MVKKNKNQIVYIYLFYIIIGINTLSCDIAAQLMSIIKENNYS